MNEVYSVCALTIPSIAYRFLNLSLEEYYVAFSVLGIKYIYKIGVYLIFL